MRIYLVQHGQAKSKDMDPDRHLTEKGESDIKKIAAFLKELKLRVEVIWHSGKTRAAQTANILALTLAADQRCVQHDGLAPNDPVDPVKEEIINQRKDLIIVGHLPFLSKLVSKLVSDSDSMNIVSFEPGGIVCLEQDQTEAWLLRWMVVPDLLM